MGLLIKLQNGDTALKSLKFGNDRLGGGSSNQPYIKNPILDEPGQLSLADDDFLLRGGLKAPINAIEDVARLTKYMFDFRSPKGLLFIAKQNILSRVAVPNEAAQKWGVNTPGAGYAGGALNQGVYTPLSTLLQAGVGFTGTHLNLMGINPFSPITGVIDDSFLPGLGLKRYEDVVKQKNQSAFNNLTVNFPIGTVENALTLIKNPLIKGLPPFAQTKLPPPVPAKSVNIGSFNNRLLNLWYNKNFNVNSDTNILQYDGGPGSILGVGKTRINFADNQRTGVNNPLFSTNKKYFINGGKTSPTQYISLDKEGNYTFASTLNYNNLLGASVQQGLTPFESGINDNGQIFTLYSSEVPYTTLSKYNPTGQTLSGYGSGGPNNIINPNTKAFTGDSDEFYQGVYSNYLTGIKNSPTDRNQLYVGKVKADRTPLNYTDFVNYRYLLGASNFQGLNGNQNYLNLDGQFISSDGEVRFFGPHLPNYTLSKFNPTSLPLTGSGGYAIGKQNHFTEKTDTTYASAIQRKLKEYGRELLSDSEFDEGGISGNARTWAPTSNTNRAIGAGSGKFIAKYSSRNSLIVDPKVVNGDFRKDIEKATLLNSPNSVGYLANLNKNSGIYEDPENPGNYVTQHNPLRVGGRGIAADFRLVNRGKRGFYDPTEKAAYDYITGTSDYTGKTLDRIYYTSADKRTSTNIDSGVDIIKFKIGIVNPTNPTNITSLNFRAYIDDFSDSYSSDWKDQTYMGRAEKFYKYSAFNRSISLGFTIVADNRANLTTMYEQLNTLAASLAPTYTTFGYMAGNLHQLTIGDYLVNQTGTMSGLTYEIVEDSPWEINEGSQLPLYIKVSGIKFTPIHSFRPESQFNKVHAYIKQS